MSIRLSLTGSGKRRVERLAERSLSRKGSPDCAMITGPPNLKYFFNYPAESFERFCCGLVTLEGTALVIPKLDEGKAENSSAGNIFTWTDSDGYANALVDALKSVGSKSQKFGCEDSISLGMMTSVRQVVNRKAEFESITESISSLRSIKDEEEVRALKDSARILCKGYEAVGEILKLDTKEKDAAFDLKKILLEAGAEKIDFCAIQSGANGAVPHLETTEKRLERGDMVVIDISCFGKSGYCADFTRTYVLGKPTTSQRQVYDIVRQAQAAGERAIKIGTPAGEIDNASRDVIEKAGYGEYFVHRTGHGIGLEVHEPPWIRKGERTRLEPGMAFTVEPGIYLPGKFGVRIEDNIVLKEKGYENLAEKLSHELIEI